MNDTKKERGLQELRDARAKSRHLYWSVGVFSFFVNTKFRRLNRTKRGIMRLGTLSLLVVFSDRGFRF